MLFINIFLYKINFIFHYNNKIAFFKVLYLFNIIFLLLFNLLKVITILEN